MMQHIVAHLAHIDDAQFERVKTMCVSVGEVVIRPLAEALSAEDRTRPRERLTAILITFGSIGRREVERLKTSPNPAVRRTAVYLLRNFGGSDALPELTELLADDEQQVQREAVRAILNIGTDAGVPGPATGAGQRNTDLSREAIMQSLGAVRDERAAPLFAYILRNVDHRGRLRSVYLRAIEALAALKDPDRGARPDGGAAPRRMVGAGADTAPAHGGGGGAGPDGHAGGGRDARRGGAHRLARRPPRGPCTAQRREAATAMKGRRMTPRTILADELLRRLAASVRSAQLYSKGHPIIVRNMAALAAAVQPLHALEPAIVIGIVGDEIIVDDTPISKAENLGAVSRRLKLLGVERVTIDRGVTEEEIATFVEAVTTLELRPDGELPAFPTLPHIRVGRVTVQQKVEALGRHGGVQAAVHRSGVGCRIGVGQRADRRAA